jgi:hypothetical protein
MHPFLAKRTSHKQWINYCTLPPDVSKDHHPHLSTRYTLSRKR